VSTTGTPNGHTHSPLGAARWWHRLGFRPIRVRPGGSTYQTTGYDYETNQRTRIDVVAEGKEATDAHWQHANPSADDLARLFAGELNVGVLCGATTGGGHAVVDLDCPEAVRAAPVLLPPTALKTGRASARGLTHWHFRAVGPFAHLTLDDPDGRGKVAELLGDEHHCVVHGTYTRKGGGGTEPCVFGAEGDPAEVDAAELENAVKRLAAAVAIARVFPVKPTDGNRHDAGFAVLGVLIRNGYSAEEAARFMAAVCVATDSIELRDRAAKGEWEREAVSTAKRLQADKGSVYGTPKFRELIRLSDKATAKVFEWLGVPDGEKVTGSFGENAAGKTKSSRWDRGGRPTGSPTPPAYTPIPPDVPFPVDILPGPWAEFVREGARVLKCDTGLVALPAIGVIASAIGMTRRIYLGGEWYEPSVLWTCVILESGGLKTPAAELSVGLVKDVQKRHLAAHRLEMERYVEDLACFKRANRSRRGRDAEDAPEVDEPKRPLLKRVLVGDITIEKLAGTLDDNPRGLLRYSDELAAHFGSFTRYKGSAGGSDEANWLSIYRADAIIYDRKTGEKTSVFVPHAAVSIVGGTQPGVLKKLLTKGLFDSGTVARFAFRLATRTPKEYVEEAIDAELKEKVTKSLNALFALESDEDSDGLPKPKVVKLAPDARQRWKRFVNYWGKKQFDTDGELAAALSKLEGMAARFALLHHYVTCDEWADTTDVRLASIEAGIQFVEWSANEAVRVYRTLNESDDATDVRKLVELVRRLAQKSPTKDRLTPAVLQRSRKEKYPTAEAATAALDSLVGVGVGTWSEGEGKPGQGGRVSRVFVLNPIPDLPNLDDEPGDAGGDDGPNLPPDEAPGGCPPPQGDSYAKDPGSRGCDELTPADAGSKLGKSGIGSGPARADTASSPPPNPDSKLGEQVGSARPPVVVTDDAGMSAAWEAVGQSERVGLDLETTGLDPRTDRVRLLSLATDSGTFLVDCFAVDPKPLFKGLANVELVGHNLAFDLAFLARMGFTPGRVCDTMLASQVLDAGTMPVLRHGLADAAERHLGERLSKDERLSDWSGALTPAQIKYAADDVTITVRLTGVLGTKLKADKLAPVIGLENRTLLGVVWMSAAGVGFDRPAWGALATEAEAEVARLTDMLNELAPGGKNLFGSDARNWNSPEQVKGAFAALGLTLEATDDATLANVDHPLAVALRDHRAAAKLVGTYGRAWLEHVAADGRVYAGWRQIGAERTGRMSCKEPNLQQLPRDPRYRKCFIAPPGRVLVKADYSQIELRLAAKISGDPVMLAAYREGKDLHAETAKAVLGLKEVTKADRQLAKALNFGLLYGMGAKGFAAYAKNQYGVTLTEAEAGRHRDKFFRTYPGLKRWHQRSTRDHAIDTFTVLGRRRRAVDKFTQQLNSPVQGSGGDGVKQALALLWERRSDCPGAFPVLVVHDEIVVEADADQADAVKVWLTSAMTDAMTPFTDPVPVAVDVSVGTTWGGD
jgi:DNA polymerase-1